MVEESLRRQGAPGATSGAYSKQPIRCGRFPALPAYCSLRPETGFGLLDQAAGGVNGRRAGLTVLAGASGCGKTTLAAALASETARSGGADLVAWVNASSRADVLVGYAQMLHEMSLADLRSQPEAAATRMLAWLAQTELRWLLVLDDVIDTASLRGLWPSGPAGHVVVTCRQTAELADLAELGGRICQVGPFSPREALTYLASRLADDTDQRAEALDLAGDVGWQPLPLGLATASIMGTTLGCRGYRQRFSARKAEMLGRMPAEQITPVEIAWSLAIDRADQRAPVGLARSVLTLLTLLDPAAVPVAVLTTQTVCSRIALPGGQPRVTEEQIWTALAGLAMIGLVDVDQPGPKALVSMHPLLQTAGARLIPGKVLDAASLVAADALFEAWSRLEDDPAHDQALRDCAISLQEKTGQGLWRPDPHPVLLRVGSSLADSGLAHHALSYWQSLLGTGARTLGPEHEQTMVMRDQFAAACAAAGQLAEAIELYQLNVGMRERSVGSDHPETLTARENLANAHRAAGLLDAAIDGYARVLTGREWALGTDSAETLTARSQLASACHQARRLDEAIKLYRRNVADWERVTSPENKETLAEYVNLGRALQAAGETDEAIRIFRMVRGVREKALGATHPETLTVIASLAYAYREAGRTKDAIPCYRQALAGREAVLGPDHPDTLTALANLASCYHSAQKLKDAVPLYERVLADRERIQGPDHPDTLTALGNLAAAYHSAGRLADAVRGYEQTVAGFTRVLGPEHPDTLTSRGNLGHAYYMARRLSDAIAVFERALADCERALGGDHPLTATMRENLVAISRLEQPPPAEGDIRHDHFI